jgi:hypothetical protein
MADVVELGYRPEGEYWNEYLLDDGTVLRFKGVVTGVFRVEGQYDPEGNPMYAVRSNNIVSVSAPDDMRKGD